MARPQSSHAESSPGQLQAVLPVVCAAVLAAAAAGAGSLVWGRTQSLAILLAAVVAGVAGAAMGRLLRRTRAGSTCALVLSVVLAAALFALAKYRVSDAWTVRSQWPEHVIGRTAFLYPAEFGERAMPDDLIPNGSVRVFSDENTKRYAVYAIYDFTGTYPPLEDALSDWVGGMLQGFRASFVAWDGDLRMSAYGDTVMSRFSYTVGGATYTGLAFGYADGSHYELLSFYPLRAPYSAAFLSRIEDGITVGGRPPFEQ